MARRVERDKGESGLLGFVYIVVVLAGEAGGVVWALIAAFSLARLSTLHSVRHVIMPSQCYPT